MQLVLLAPIPAFGLSLAHIRESIKAVYIMDYEEQTTADSEDDLQLHNLKAARREDPSDSGCI